MASTNVFSKKTENVIQLAVFCEMLSISMIVWFYMTVVYFVEF